MGFILSSFVWSYAIMNLPSGCAVDRFGTKILMTNSVAIWSIVSGLTGFARAITYFIIIRVILVWESPLCFLLPLKQQVSLFAVRRLV
jgi:MFS family permease